MTVDGMALELAADRIASLEHDVVAYRGLAQVALAKLADVTRDRDRLREQLREFRREFRREHREAA